MEQIMFNDGTPDGTTPPANDGQQTPPEQPPKTETQVSEKELRLQIQRELSKELGVNLFEADGLKQVKELIDSQKTEQERLQEQLNAYQTKEAEWQKQQLNYQAQLKASELGINPEFIGDALKLADNDPDKLADVIKKYPTFQTKQGVQIGFQNPYNSTPPSGKNAEMEAYMASNPMYASYFKNKK